MVKIIVRSLKAAAKNIELALIFFAVNILIKFIFSEIKTVSIVHIILSISVNLFLVASSIKVLINDSRYNKWHWKEYLSGGISGLPYIIIWVIFILGMLNIFLVLLKFMQADLIRKYLILLIASLGYITAVLPIAVISGEKIRDAFKLSAITIKNNPVLFIGIGVYLLLLITATNFVIFTLWAKAMEYGGTISGKALVIAGEVIRSATCVVILSTLVRLVLNHQERTKMVHSNL